MNKAKKTVILVTVLIVLITAWVGFNPIGRFGFCRFGLLVYSAIPFPGVDLVIHANGLPSVRGSTVLDWTVQGKAHFVGLAEIEPLLRERPDVLIIGTGYDDMVRVEKEILAMSSVQVLPLPTPQAVMRYNELRREGRRVAAIIHSTC